MTYEGFDVLTDYLTFEGLEISIERGTSLLDGRTGKIDSYSPFDFPVWSHRVDWVCTTRAAIAALKTWIAARYGQAVPVWITSGVDDLPLAANVSPGATSISIHNMGYTRNFFPDLPRRRIAFVPPSGRAGMECRKITNAVAGSTTETLTLDSATVSGFTAGLTMVSFLHLCCLAQDSFELHWHTTGVVTASAVLVEDPQGVPA